MATGIAQIDVELTDPTKEQAFLAWWDEAQELLTQRFRLEFGALHVLDQGVYRGVFGFPLPGTWKLVEKDRRFGELWARRPRGEYDLTQARAWHARGNPRDISTSELLTLVGEQGAGGRDALIIDTMIPASYAQQHLPGAINIPFDDLNPEVAAAAIGDNKTRLVVVYCSGYT